MSRSTMSLNEIDAIIDEAVAELDVPPSLRVLVKSNLSSIANNEGLEAVQHKIHLARARKERASDWLRARRSVVVSEIPAKSEADIVAVEDELWIVIQEIAREKVSVRSWARHFLDAASKIDREKFFDDAIVARDACESIFRATTADDFDSEPPVIRGSVLSEAGNMYFACAALTNNQQVMEESLAIYGNAVRELSQVHDPSVERLVDVVQLNRGSALSFFVSIVGEKIEKYKVDASSVMQHIVSLSPDFGSEYGKYEVKISDICQNLERINTFSNDFPKPIAGSNLRKPPIEPVVLFNTLTAPLSTQ